MLQSCCSSRKPARPGSATKRRRQSSAAADSQQRPGLRPALEIELPSAAAASTAVGHDEVELQLDPAESPMPVELMATMSLYEELPWSPQEQSPPPPSPALPPPASPILALARQMSTEDELSAMLASVTCSTVTSSMEFEPLELAHGSMAVVGEDADTDTSIGSMDHSELSGILPGGDDAVLAAVPGWHSISRSPPMAAPDSLFQPVAAAGSVEKGVGWAVFQDGLETDATPNGSQIVGLREADHLLVWNSKLRDAKPPGLSTLRLDGVGAGRMPAAIELRTKGRQEPVAVERVQTVAAFTTTSFTGLKVERSAVDDGASGRCDLHVAFRVGPYEATPKAAGGGRGSAQKLGCDRACCFVPTADIGFTAAPFNSSLSEDEWLIPHAFSETRERACAHTLPASTRNALQGKKTASGSRTYPFYFVAVLENDERVLIQGSFRLQSGSDERIAAMTQQKKRWRQTDENHTLNKRRKERAAAAAAAGAGRGPTLAELDANGLPLSGGLGKEGCAVYMCRCKRCGQPKAQSASTCPCPKSDGALQQMMAGGLLPIIPATKRPEWTSSCKHCGQMKRQPASKCACNGTGHHPSPLLSAAAAAGVADSLVIEAAALAAAKAEVRADLDALEADGVVIGEGEHSPASAVDAAASLASTLAEVKQEVIDGSETVWDSLVPTEVAI